MHHFSLGSSQPKFKATPSFLFTLILIVACLFSAGCAHAQGTLIPNVQQWTSGTGSFSFSSGSRIVLDPYYASQLNTTANVLANDINYFYGVMPTVAIGSPNTGDIYLTLNSTDSQVGSEGYSMIIGSYVSISAKTDGGAFYGTRTFLQYLKQSWTISAGTIKDWPVYPVRGLMVDVGDMYFSMQWLENHIRDLAYLKLNTLHLHFSDNFGFRLASTSHPELDNGMSQTYSHSDLQTLTALAAQYHINIIPEIESPSHSTRIVAQHPELELVGPNGTYPKPNMLDITIPGTRTLVNDLYNEFMPYFPGPYWGCGTDEYVSGYDFSNNTYPQFQTYAQSHFSSTNGVDTYLDYCNWLDGLVKANGKQARGWEDAFEYSGTAVSLKNDIALELWLFVNPNTAISSKFNVSNATSNPLYYNVGITTPGDSGILQNLYESWAPNLEYGAGNGNNWSVTMPNPQVQGAKYHIWVNNTNGSGQQLTDTESNIAAGIMNFMRALAQNCWGSPKIVSTASSFTPLITTIGHAPGYGTAAGPITVAPLPATGEAPYAGTAAIPGTVQLENYDTGAKNVAYYDTTVGNSGGQYRTDDADIETCADAGGGYDIGSCASGEWFRYMVNVATTGTYTVGFRVAGSGGTLHLEDTNGTNLTGTVSTPNTGGWQTWSTVNVTVMLTAGAHILKLVEDSANYNLNYVTFTLNSSPFGGVAAAVPGTVPCSNYDVGGANVAYYDTTTGNSGGVYRADNVDLEATSDTTGGYDVAACANGEWFNYTVNVKTGGAYTVGFRVASGSSGGTLHLQDTNGTNLTGTVSVPGTGGWQTWSTVNATVNLTTGLHTLRIVEDSANYNLNNMTFTLQYTGTPYGGNAWPIPGTVQVENYDAGGQNVTYYDTTTGNSGGKYRTDDVDMEICSDTGGGYDVANTPAGEWLKFTVNVSNAGTHTVGFRVAKSGTTTTTLHVVDELGNNLTGTVTVPNTGGWQTWTTVNATVTLTAGQHVLKLIEDTGGYNLNYMSFN